MLESIKKLGLNEYESKAYFELLKKGNESAVSISKDSGIPRARIYDILFSLEKKGFVMRSTSKPIKFGVIKPTSAFNKVAKEKRTELDQHLEEFKIIAQQLEDSSDYSSNLGEDSAWTLEGRDNIYTKISEQLENCKDTVIISSTKEGIDRKKSVFDAKLAELEKKGVKVITKPGDNSRFMVFDTDSVLLFMNQEKEKNNEKALLIKSPFIANYFQSTVKK